VARYLEILVPDRFTVLGLELKPLSVGHILLLEKFGCLEPKDEGEFVLAVLICSQRPQDVPATLDDRWLWLKVRLWFWRLGAFDWNEKAKIFSKYIEAHTATPAFRSLNERGSSLEHSGTPHVQHVRVTLMSKLNYAPTEAWEVGFGQAMFDYLTYHENEGAVEILDREHRAEMREEADRLHHELVDKFKAKFQ